MLLGYFGCNRAAGALDVIELQKDCGEHERRRWTTVGRQRE